MATDGLPPESDLVEQYAPLVQKLAAKLAKRTHFRADVEDLYSEGMIGLLLAARSFDQERGVQFGTYAGHRISGAMTDSIRNMDWVPRLARERSKAGQAKREANYKATGEKSEQVNKVERATARGGRCKEYASDWSDPVATGGLDTTFQGRAKAPNPYVAAEQADSIRALMRHLDSRSRMVVLSAVVVGLDQKTIGKAVGVSESRVSQIRIAAIKSLRGKLQGTMYRAMGT